MRQLRLTALMLVLFVIPLQFMSASSRVTDEQDRLIEVPSFPTQPVRITSVKTRKGELKVGEKFKDTDGWFKGLTIRIKNVSDKPVNYVSALVTFIRPKEQREEGRLPFGERLTYGISPVDLNGSATPGPAPSIPPGESIELGLPETDSEEYTAMLKRLAFPDAIKRIEISLQEVGFEDGVLWSGGRFWRRDPSNLNKYVPVSKGKGESPFFLKRPTPRRR